MSRVSKQQVQRCKVHQAIKERMIQTLEDHDAFSLSVILEETGYGLFADAVHWPHLRDIIAEETGRELIPVSHHYFQAHDIQDEFNEPGRYLAGGGDRVTAGYVQYSSRTSHLANYNLVRRRNMIEGSAKRYDEGCDQMRNYVGELSPVHDRPLLPLIRGSKDDEVA